jgi:hypothetical protein
LVLFFRKVRQAPLALLVGDARPNFGVQTQGSDSEMAPEAIEIAQNGLVEGDPSARRRV